MRLTRVYIDAPLTAGQRVALAGSAATHITRVLRLRAGDALTLFNGQGGEYPARIAEARGGRLTVALGEAQPIERESALGLTLAQGVSRGERMDLVVQKATELGVGAIAPVFTERSVVRLSAPQAARKLEHWRAIAVAACEQSGRNRLPRLSAPVPLADFLKAAEPGTRLLLSPGAPARIRDLPQPAAAVTVLIGPEGGLTEPERESAVAAGFTPVRLGPRVLRTETAALAALSVLQSAFGDF
jgi:16S rRNA (uracil1498-N3)-methyltransferase